MVLTLLLLLVENLEAVSTLVFSSEFANPHRGNEFTNFVRIVAFQR